MKPNTGSKLTCCFSARTVTAALLCLVLNTGVRPAMLPRLERLPARRVDAQGNLTALEEAATCMMYARVTVASLQMIQGGKGEGHGRQR